MEYRKLPHGEEKISVLGLGSSSIGGSGEKKIARAAEMSTSEQITPQENMAGLPAWIRLKNLSTGS